MSEGFVQHDANPSSKFRHCAQLRVLVSTKRYSSRFRVLHIRKLRLGHTSGMLVGVAVRLLQRRQRLLLQGWLAANAGASCSSTFLLWERRTAAALTGWAGGGSGVAGKAEAPRAQNVIAAAAVMWVSSSIHCVGTPSSS